MLTDGGIETTLIYHDGLDLPHFAAFDLLKDGAGTDALLRYFDSYAAVAAEHAGRLRAGEPYVARKPRLGSRSSATRSTSSTSSTGRPSRFSRPSAMPTRPT